MLPIIFSLGPITIYSYGFMIALGLLLTFTLIKNRGGIDGIDSDALIDCSIMTACAGIVGARIFYIIRFVDEFQGQWLAVFKIWEGGLILYGGVIGSLLFLFIYSKRTQQPFFRITDALVPYFAFVQGFGRFGCFLNGCCGGRQTDFFFSITFNNTTAAVHPTQFYSAALCFCIASLLMKLSRSPVRTGLLTTMYFLIYPVGRFYIEMLRTNPSVFLGFSSAQVISIILFFLAVIVFITNQFWKPNDR